MNTPHSAAYIRLQEQLKSVREIDPRDRVGLYAALHKMIQGVTVRKLDEEMLRHMLDIRDAFGSVVYIADLSEKPGENHYADAVLTLLERAEAEEQDRRRLVPGMKRAVENSSGSLGATFGATTEALSIDSEVVIPDSLSPARTFRVREFNAHGTVTLASSAEGFIRGMSQMLEQRLRELFQESIPALCLNHSRSEATIQGFQTVGEEILTSLPDDIFFDYWISGVGNGGSTLGISNALLKDDRWRKRQLVCYKDAASIGENVTMEGIGGQGNVFFPFTQQLPPHRIIEFRPNDWFWLYNRNNKGKKRRETIGHSSAGGLAAIRRIINEEHRPLKFLTQIYDKADTNGSTLVTRDDAQYIENEQWSDGIDLTKLKT